MKHWNKLNFINGKDIHILWTFMAKLTNQNISSSFILQNLNQRIIEPTERGTNGFESFRIETGFLSESNISMSRSSFQTVFSMLFHFTGQ